MNLILCFQYNIVSKGALPRAKGIYINKYTYIYILKLDIMCVSAITARTNPDHQIKTNISLMYPFLTHPLENNQYQVYLT